MYQFTGKIGQFYKFNANCKQEEKQGTGPGSCSSDKNENDISTKLNYLNNRLRELETAKSKGQLYIMVGKNRWFANDTNIKDIKNQINDLSLSKNKDLGNEIIHNQPEIISTPNAYTPSKKFLSSNVTRLESNDSITFKHESGLYIKVPKTQEDIAKNTLKLMEEMPQKLIDNIKFINFSKEKDFASGLGFQSLATASDRMITVHGNGKEPFKLSKEDLAHELAHVYDGPSFEKSGNRYKKAVLSDKTNDISSYSKFRSDKRKYDNNRFMEDYADAVALYVVNPNKLKKLAPNRYDYIKNVNKL